MNIKAGAHIDCEPWDTIASLSLGSSCVMDFTNKDDKTKKIPVWLEPRSLIVLSGKARSGCTVLLPENRMTYNGVKYDTATAGMLTFRKVIIEKEKRDKDEI